MAKWLHISKRQVDDTLAVAPTPGKKTLEPFRSFAKANSLPLQFLEDHELQSGVDEVHEHEADLWLALEGESVFTCDGEEVMMHPGDWLWIPAGVVHSHKASGTARLAIIKVPSKYS